MDTGTYDVIKSRLEKQGDQLKSKAQELNGVRKDVFGSIESKLLASQRIITENNCMPRDMAPVHDKFIFGYNVKMGLKTKVGLGDVFSVYTFGHDGLEQASLDLIDDPQFIKDFDDLYLYYKDAFFAKITILDPYLYMIFQTGKSPTDIKVFKWHIEGPKLTYVDNRSDHEVKFKLGNDFDFVKVTRDDQRTGIHPHVSIMDKVFVETVGGDLTIKVEDNTATGKGIYCEDVVDPDQTLDDAEISYVDLGQLIVLKILPYKETTYRYFIYNQKLKNVVRIDSIEKTCMLLPNGHGLIFPQGYYLQSGDHKLFDVPVEQTVFDQVNASVNGEDYQYIFYNLESGTYLIYSYNLIEQTIDMPIVCSGYSHFSKGEMLVFKHGDEPRKNHALQVWQTPYVGKDYQSPGKHKSDLFKIGNKDIVNCIAACRGVIKLIAKGESYESVYLDIVKESQRILDAYFWLDTPDALEIAQVVKAIKETATFAIGEFEKVSRIKNKTQGQIQLVSEKTEDLLKTLTYGTYEKVSDYVEVLGEIRQLRGEIVSLGDLMYTDPQVVDKLDQDMKAKNKEFSQACVNFLISPDGLKPYEEAVSSLQEKIDLVDKSSEGQDLGQAMDKISVDLELLMDIISNFKIDDPTVTTEIIDKISGLFSLINHAKAKLKSKVEAFNQEEMAIQFNAQIRLLSQAVVNYLEVSDTEEKCDQYLNKVMVQVQELEGKFSEFQDYLLKLDEKRQEIYGAFESKKQRLLDKLNKRLVALFDSSQRIIAGMTSRMMTLKTLEEINGYLATDIMAEKVRDIVGDLRGLGDNVKADEITSNLKALKENTLRQLKDKEDLYLEGDDVIKLGNHHFSVNKKAIDLSVIHKDSSLYYHITGTDFWDPLVHPAIEAFEHVYDQTIVSENRQTYRGEYLAYSLFKDSQEGKIEDLTTLYNMSDQVLQDRVRTYMESRYQEGYTKGVHDSDASKILRAVLDLDHTIGLLVYKREARCMARLFWHRLVDKDLQKMVTDRLGHLSSLHAFFTSRPKLDDYLPWVKDIMAQAYKPYAYYHDSCLEKASEYLCLEVMAGRGFVVSLEAKTTYDGFMAYLRDKDGLETFEKALANSRQDLQGQFFLVKAWLDAYWDQEGASLSDLRDPQSVLEEVRVILLEDSVDFSNLVSLPTHSKLEGLVGSHPAINKGQYDLVYTDFIKKLEAYAFVADDFLVYQTMKKDLIKAFKETLKLEDFKPNVLTSFVRNQLIDQVYLPLVGDNLAKQMGVVGEDKRTDLMGLLLLISPPGYGKTTLMEYIASRLGFILVKVNGPSLGHEVTSLDPEKAGHSSAKEELRKLNLALKMGNNIMLYLDDIQHCNPEFLQKFISLCDGQRKIEGVYNGLGQTYDLRGKKIAVVMAGNPYTESGEKFKIPDMLANRADVYNLGDMLGENEEAFKLSYIENSLTSNPVLAKLSSKSQKDIHGLVQIASGVDRQNVVLESTFSPDELNAYVSVLEKLNKVRDIVLKINMAYIYSAAQNDAYREEPAFKLQGSYRNMNKIAEKVVAVMNDEELFATVLASYENDCQTLTSGAESNLLKWKSLVGCLTDEEAQRYEVIKGIFMKNKAVNGQDSMGQAVGVLSDLSDHMASIKEILENK